MLAPGLVWRGCFSSRSSGLGRAVGPLVSSVPRARPGFRGAPGWRTQTERGGYDWPHRTILDDTQLKLTRFMTLARLLLFRVGLGNDAAEVGVCWTHIQMVYLMVDLVVVDAAAIFYEAQYADVVEAVDGGVLGFVGVAWGVDGFFGGCVRGSFFGRGSFGWAFRLLSEFFSGGGR